MTEDNDGGADPDAPLPDVPVRTMSTQTQKELDDNKALLASYMSRVQGSMDELLQRKNGGKGKGNTKGKRQRA